MRPSPLQEESRTGGSLSLAKLLEDDQVDTVVVVQALRHIGAPKKVYSILVMILLDLSMVMITHGHDS